MKKLEIWMLCIALMFLGSLSQAQVIDFEDAPALGLSELDEVSDQYRGNGRICGIQFFIGDPANGVHPVLAEVGSGPSNSPANTNLALQAAFRGVLDFDCSGDTLTNDDMPASKQINGCFFLTDDGAVGPTSPPDSLTVVYDVPVSVASGDLLDIDGAEAWEIEGFDVNGASTGISIINFASPGAGDALSTQWIYNSTTGVPFEILRFRFTGSGSYVGLAFDNFAPCSGPDDEVACCPELRNLIGNGDFEDDGFIISDYEPNTPDNALVPGEYTIVDAGGAAEICPNWEICRDNGNVLAINGAACDGFMKTVWYRDIGGLEGGETYKFCADFRNMAQCCFDVKPSIGIQFSTGAGSFLNRIIDVDQNDPCNWETIDATITLPPNVNNLGIQIVLDEGFNGDGNDLLIDNLSLVELEETSPIFTSFTYAPTPVDPYTTLPAVIASLPLPAGCNCAWSVCEVPDLSLGSPCVQNTEINDDPLWRVHYGGGYCDGMDFAGYDGTDVLDSAMNPGVFSTSRNYRITRTVFCECSTPLSQPYIIGASRNGFRDIIDGNTGELIDRIPVEGGTESEEGRGRVNNENESSINKTYEFIPNPVNDVLTVISKTKTTTSYQLLNTEGKVFKKGMLGLGNNQLNVADLSAGVYFIKIADEEEITTEKIIIAR